MDNTLYHSVMTAWRKADIVAWLNLKSTSFEESCMKTELSEFLKQNEHKFKKFILNYIAEKSRHAFLRPPHYHCILNVTELIWSNLKGYVAH